MVVIVSRLQERALRMPWEETTMVSSATAANGAADNLGIQKLRVEQMVKAGAGWFLWIACLSIVNSIIGMAGGGVHFIVGLGLTQVVDIIAHRVGSSGIVLDLIINGFVVGTFVLFWNFAKKGQSWAFIIGMALYALDALLLITFKDVFSVAFHAYALFRIYHGLKAAPTLERLEQSMIFPAAPIVPK
jgi:hypothetical protein